MTDQKRGPSRRAVVGGIGAAAVAGSFGLMADEAFALPLKVRSDLASIAGKRMLGLYKKAVGLMLARGEWDPKSWYFQANIHSHPYLVDPQGEGIQVKDEARAIFNKTGATADLRTLALGADGTGQDGVWNTCTHHRGYREHFLSWHRLYLYHFENVIESVLGEPFALPYWNYTDPKSPAKRKLPKEFAKPVSGSNPLHFEDRAKSFLNNGLRIEDIRAKATLKSSVYMDPPVNSEPSETGFNYEIDDQPHGQVHTRVGTPGKGMQSFELAARDPLFWVHHAQIDRLWESWRRPRVTDGLSPARDPSDAAWLDREFTFAKPDGSPSIMKARKSLQTKKELNYRYDTLQDVKLVTLAVAAGGPSQPAPSTTLSASATGTAAAITAKEVPVPVDITPSLSTDAAKALIRKPSSQFMLVIGVEAKTNPGCVYDVFLKVKPNLNAPATEERFIETFNLFGAVHAGHGGHKPITWQADITDLVRASKFDPTVPGQIIVKCRFEDPIGPAVIKSVTVEAR